MLAWDCRRHGHHGRYTASTVTLGNREVDETLAIFADFAAGPLGEMRRFSAFGLAIRLKPLLFEAQCRRRPATDPPDG
jgi:hypothetical protein